MLRYNIAIQPPSCTTGNIPYNCWQHFNCRQQHNIKFEIRADVPSQYHIKVNSTEVIVIKATSTTVNIISTAVNTWTVKIITVNTITVKCTTTTAGYLGSGLELCQPKLFQPCHSSLLHCHTHILFTVILSYFVQQKNILFNAVSYSYFVHCYAHVLLNRRIFCSLFHSYFVQHSHHFGFYPASKWLQIFKSAPGFWIWSLDQLANICVFDHSSEVFCSCLNVWPNPRLPWCISQLCWQELGSVGGSTGGGEGGPLAHAEGGPTHQLQLIFSPLCVRQAFLCSAELNYTDASFMKTVQLCPFHHIVRPCSFFFLGCCTVVL